MKCPGFGAGNSSLVRDVGKCSVAVISIQNIATILSHKKIGIAVIVEISPHATEPVSGSGDAGLFSDIGERTVTVVAIECIAYRNPSIVEITSIDEINILPAIAIEVGDADSRTKLLAINRNPFIPFEVNKLDTSRGSYIC